MNTDDKYKGENASDLHKEPTYRLLGESGLVEDEEGNFFSASEIYDSGDEDEHDILSNDELFSESFKKSSMPDWAAIYDPRYCGPSREAYIDEMTKKYNASTSCNPQPQSEFSGNAQPHSDISSNPQPQSEFSGKAQPHSDISGNSQLQSEFSGKAQPHSDISGNSQLQSVSPGNSQPQSGAIFSSPIVVSTDSDNTTSSDSSPKPEKPSSDVEHTPSDTPGPNLENRYKIHLTTGTIVFYVIFVILFIAYFIFLIYQLISLIAQLF